MSTLTQSLLVAALTAVFSGCAKSPSSHETSVTLSESEPVLGTATCDATGVVIRLRPQDDGKYEVKVNTLPQVNDEGEAVEQLIVAFSGITLEQSLFSYTLAGTSDGALLKLSLRRPSVVVPPILPGAASNRIYLTSVRFKDASHDISKLAVCEIHIFN